MLAWTFNPLRWYIERNGLYAESTSLSYNQITSATSPWIEIGISSVRSTTRQEYPRTYNSRGHQCMPTLTISDYPILKQLLYTTKEIAQEYLMTLDSQPTMSPFLPASQCMVIHKHTSTIHGRYNAAFPNAVALPEIIGYLKKKHQWRTETADLFHWKWFKSAVRQHSHSSHNHLTKLVYNQLATSARKHQTGGKSWIRLLICPHCHNQEETFFQHMIRCDHPAATTFRKNLIDTIQQVCHSRKAAPTIIRKTLMSWISTWLHNGTPKIKTLDQRLHRLHQAQQEIGWDLLVRGFFAAKWGMLSLSTITTSSFPN